jgi:hypothetical protein
MEVPLRNCPLFYIDYFACYGSSLQKIGLTAKKGRYLQDINVFGRFGTFVMRMYIACSG